jgi:hypothetical protein
MRTHLAIIILLCSAIAINAQQPPAKQSEPLDQPVIDDDGGRAFIINPKLKAKLLFLPRVTGSVVHSPQQFSIFLGSEWTSASLRERQIRLTSLLSGAATGPEADRLNSAGIDNLFDTTYSREVPTNFADDEKVSDLAVRAVLTDLMNSASLPPVESQTIYVIFLEPGVVSTLGPLTGRKQYLAYHNFLNVAGKRLHYVVVPYEPNVETQRVIALHTIVAAAVNPGSSQN